MGRFFFGAKIIDQLAPNTAGGASFTVPVGTYLLTVTGEEIEICRGATIAQGQGTPLVRATQLMVDLFAPETWAIRSLGGTGRLVLTTAQNNG